MEIITLRDALIASEGFSFPLQMVIGTGIAIIIIVTVYLAIILSHIISDYHKKIFKRKWKK